MNTDQEEKLTIDREIPHDLIVRLGNSSQEPTTSIERLIIAILQREAPIPLHLLVQRVADELYQQELDAGAWVLDLGVVGSGLFAPDAASAVRAGNRTLWQIEKQS